MQQASNVLLLPDIASAHPQTDARQATEPTVSPVRTPSSLDKGFVAVVILLTVVLVRLLGESSDVQHGSPLAEGVWLIAYAGAFVGLARSRHIALQLIFRSPLLVSIVCLAMLSALWSDDAVLTMRRAVGLAGSTAFAYYVVANFDLADFLDVLATVMGALALLSIALVFGAPDVGRMQDVYVGAWQGIFNHKNGLGINMALGMITLLAAVRRTSVRHASAKYALAGVCGVCVVGSQSITGILLAVVCGALFALLLLSRRGAGGKALAIALVGAFAVGGGVLALLDSSVADLLGAIGRDTSLTGRTDIWPAVIQAITDRPLLGFGYEVFWTPDGLFRDYIQAGAGWRPFHAHNGYLETALDLGLTGLGLSVVTLLYGIAQAITFWLGRSTIVNAWPLTVITYFALLNLTESTIAKYNSFTWIIFVAAFLYAVEPRTTGPARFGAPEPKRSS